MADFVVGQKFIFPTAKNKMFKKHIYSLSPGAWKTDSWEDEVVLQLALRMYQVEQKYTFDYDDRMSNILSDSSEVTCL